MALISPAGPADPARVARGAALLRGWGLRVTIGAHAHARTGYLAGADPARLGDLNTAMADPRVRAVVCTRGGFGTQRIVDDIDVAAVVADPKLVVGFSDITALHLALWRRARLATVYGPGAAWVDERTGPESAESLRRTLMHAEPVVLTAADTEETFRVRRGAHAGVASGTLLGGNLALLAASVGTPDQPDPRGAILLVEDVNEPPYRVDRMLTQLHRAGALIGLSGVAVGQFTDCGSDTAPTVPDVLADRFGALGVPVLGGLRIGHGVGQLSVPLGVPAVLDVEAGTLTVEPAVC